MIAYDCVDLRPKCRGTCGGGSALLVIAVVVGAASWSCATSGREAWFLMSYPYILWFAISDG